MSLLKSINRLQRLHYFIKNEATGTSEEFSKKLGISRSMLMENLREMKDLGAAICFCPHRRTYFYSSEFDLFIGNASKEKIKGGIFYQSNGTGRLAATFGMLR
jgi:DNA-binding transcriptional regulator GbsR (MarR family)